MKEYSIISNTTPLISFIKKNELSLLKNIFSKIIIPEAVYNEIINIPENLDKEKEIFKNELKEKWIIIKKVSSPKFNDLNLGKGETEAFNLYFETNNPLLLIDEKKGRNLAKSLKIDVLGTLGIFSLIYKRELKNKKELLENLSFLIAKGFYLSSEVILSFLNGLSE